MDQETKIVAAVEELDTICRVDPRQAAKQWLYARCEALKNERRCDELSEEAEALRAKLNAVRAILATVISYTTNDIVEIAAGVAAMARRAKADKETPF